MSKNFMKQMEAALQGSLNDQVVETTGQNQAQGAFSKELDFALHIGTPGAQDIKEVSFSDQTARRHIVDFFD